MFLTHTTCRPVIQGGWSHYCVINSLSHSWWKTFFLANGFTLTWPVFLNRHSFLTFISKLRWNKNSCCSGDRRSCYTRCKVSLGLHVTIFSHYLNKEYIEVVQVPGNKDFLWCWQTLRPQMEVLTCRKRCCYISVLFLQSRYCCHRGNIFYVKQL